MSIPQVSRLVLGMLIGILFFPATLFGEQGTIRIVNGVGVTTNGDYIVGNTGPFNQLLVTNSGNLSNASGMIGASSTAVSNAAIITGTNSLWANSSSLTIGSAGSFNRLLITNGARATCSSTFLGGASGNNVAVIVGSNSRWDWGGLYVGYAGSSNDLFVIDVDQVVNGDVRIGATGGASANRMIVSGTNTIWNPGVLHVGSDGSRNSLIISNGARVRAVITIIGYQSSGNTLECSGVGTVFDTGLFQYSVGQFGSSNTFIVADGAAATGGAAIGGLESGGDNGVIVRGSNAIWRGGAWIGAAGTGNFFEVMNGGRAEGGDYGIGNALSSALPANWLRISGGTLSGNVSAYRGYVTLDSGMLAAGGLSVTPATTTWFFFNGGSLSTTNSTIDSGTNAFALGTSTNIPASWQVLGSPNTLKATGGVLLGQSPGVHGAINISGPTALLAIEGPVFLGSNGVTGGRGMIRIQNGGLLKISELTTGTGETGTLTNDGGILLFSNAPSLFNQTENGIVVTNGTIRFRDSLNASATVASGYPIKFQGENTLDLDNSSSAPLGTLLLQRNSSPFSRIRLIGGTTLLQGTDLVIGEGGLLLVSNTSAFLRINGGTMTITNGGRFVAGTGTGVGYVGFNCDSSNNVASVAGTNSSWSIADSLFVGCDGGSNRLFIGSAGQVSNVFGYVGFSTNSAHNLVVVSDSGSAWRNSGALVVGASGASNTVVISNGAAMFATAMFIGSNIVSEGNTILVDAGNVTGSGTIVVGAMGSNNTLVITNSGNVMAGGLIIGSSSLAQGSGVRVQNGNLTINQGTIDVRNGFVQMDGSRIAARSLLLTNALRSSFNFLSGILNLRDITTANDRSFVIGDGISSAALQLGNRVSTFSNGVAISSNAVLILSSNVTGTITNTGTFAPTNALSGVAINGDLYQQPSGRIYLFVNGEQRYTQFGSAKFNGTAFLDGSLQVALGGGFIPKSTNVFILIEFNNAVGFFTNVVNGGRLSTIDGLGSFAITFTATNVYATDFRFDRDGDGIDDAWTLQYFGHTPLTFAERTADSDGDGASNYDEFRAATNPTDASSSFRVAYFSKGQTVATMRFSVVTDHGYSIWFSSNLVTWQRVNTPVLQPISTNLVEWQDDGTKTGGSLGNQRFYKASTP